MAGTAGSITVDLLMKTGSFETDTKRAGNSMDDLSKKAKVVGAALAVAFVAAGTAMAVMVKKSIDNMDAMSKMSAAAGTTIENFSAMAYAADLSGVSQQELGDAFIKLSKNMGDAAVGTGEALKAFTKMGISAKDANGNLRDTQSVLEDVSEKFSKMGNSTEKTSLAVQLFGRSGAKLIPLLNSGRDGLQQMRDEAQKLGLVLDGNAAAAAEAFNDNLLRLGKVQEGLANTLTIELLPVLNDFTDELSNAALETGGLHEAVRDFGRNAGEDLRSIVAVIGLIGDGFSAANKAADDFGKMMQSMLGVAEEDTRSFSDNFTKSFTQSFLDTAKELDQLVAVFTGHVGGMQAVVEALGSNIATIFKNAFDKAMEYVSEAILKAVDAMNGAFGTRMGFTLFGGPGDEPLKNVLDAYKEGYAANRKLLGAHEELLRRMHGKSGTGGFDSSDNPMPWLLGGQSGTGAGSSAGGKGKSKGTKATKQTRSYIATDLDEMLIRMGEATEWLDSYEVKAEKTFDKTGEFALEAARNIQQSLGDGLYDILSGNFDDIGSKFADTLTRMVADAASKNLAGALFGDFDSQAGGGKIGGIFGKIIGSIWPSTSALSGVTASPSLDLGATFGSGGFTGHGGKFDPAGIVHKGEYVLSQDATRRIGRGTLDRMNDGYASGGLVGGAGPAGGVSVNITNQGQPVSASQPKVSMDSMGRMVIDIMIRDAQKNGPYIRQLQGAM